ncbi:MAG: DUF47 family protein [Clostridia bacterium]|nr:DUF47 family protein [Clostridia bacterium]
MLKKNSNVHSMIVEQIKDVETCLINFENFMRAATTTETVHETLRALCIGVQDAENEADRSLRAMIDALSEGSYLPSTREDIISIATSCDKVANKCETISKIVVFQRFRCPGQYASDFNDIFTITKEQFELLEKSISMLFSKMNVLQKDSSILDEIRSLESKVDRIEDKLNEDIFTLDISLAEKVQISHIVELLCDLSDIIEDIADKIQIMLIARKA